MRAVEEDDDWDLLTRLGENLLKRSRQGICGRKSATAAWQSADPGLHFNTTMNDWHTCTAAGPIRASNPCSEYMFLDDTACNLASI